MSAKDSDERYEAEGKFAEGKDQAGESKEGVATADSKDAVGGGSTSRSLSNSELIDRVQEYFFLDEELAKTFEGFVERECGVVDLQSEEYKLEYTDAFNKYKALFEHHMEGFIINKLGSSSRAFYSALKEKMDENDTSNEAIFGQILLAVTDFDVFMTMMREQAQKKSHK